MNVIRKIKYYCKTDEDLKRFAESRIRKLTKLSKQDNKGKIIGAELDVNPNVTIFKDMDELATYHEKPVWFGFIPKGVKIVYGRMNNVDSGLPSNVGYFYYHDDVSYIYDFYKYIKDLEFSDCNDVMSLVNDYMDKMFLKYFNAKSRVTMHKLVRDKNNRCFEPIKEHLFSDFFGNGSARCSEFALMAQNLFSSLDLDMVYMIDKEHAYNVFMDPKDPEKKDYYDFYIVDFSNCVPVYDYNHEFKQFFPFIGKLEGEEKQFINMIKKGERVEFQDYMLYQINDNDYKILLDSKRSYGIDAKLSDIEIGDRLYKDDEDKPKSLILGK
jgi:hypothetical protein